MLVQEICLKTSIRCWLNETHVCWKEKYQNKLLWSVLYLSFSNYFKGEKEREKCTLWNPPCRGRENKDPLKQYYCCSSSFSSGNLQFTPHQPSAFTPNRVMSSVMLLPLKAFMFFPLVQWPSVTIFKSWSNYHVKQNQSLYSQKSLFYITESIGTVNYQKREWKRKLYRNILYLYYLSISL